jgi:hypothetical protein
MKFAYRDKVKGCAALIFLWCDWVSDVVGACIMAVCGRHPDMYSDYVCCWSMAQCVFVECVSGCMCACVYVCMCVYVCLCVYVCMCVCAYVRM